MHDKIFVKYLRPLVVSTLILCAAFSCSRQPVTLGFVDGLSGKAADLGISSRDGAILAVEQRNARGGVNGREVRLVIKDDQHDVDVAKEVIQDLIRSEVIAIIGHGTSIAAVETAPLATTHKVLMLSHTATSKQLSIKGDYFFRVVNSADKFAVKNAKFRRNVLKEKNIAIAYDVHNQAYSKSWLEDFVSTFQQEGGNVLKILPYNDRVSPSLNEVALSLLDSKADGILIIGNASDTASICKYVREMNKTINLGTSEWAATEGLVAMGGASVEGIYSSQFIDRESTAPQYLKFRQEYSKRFGREPGFGGVMAYEATNVILDAVEKGATRESMPETILSIREFKGLQGKIRFNDAGDADRPSYITTIIRGKFHTYEN